MFLFERAQDEVTGSDGDERFRKPFRDARLSVVLLRPGYGERGWTGVERTAIVETCLKQGYRNLFAVRMEPMTIPDWIPDTHIYFDIEAFPVEQLIGAIKARVIERGGRPQPMTVAKRAEIHKANAEYEDDRKRFRTTSDGLVVLQEELEKLYAQIREKVKDLKDAGIDVEHGSLTARSGVEYGSLTARFGGRCGIRQRDVGMIMFWRFQGLPRIDQETLVVEEYNRHIILPREPRVYLDGRGPIPVRAFRYELELSRSREPVWKRQSDGDIYSTSSLAEAVLIRFLSLIDEETAAANRAPRG